MAVTSKPLDNGQPVERTRKQSAILSRAQIDRQRGAVERAMAYILLIVSFVGTVVAFHGGWMPLLANGLRWPALLAGVLLQVLLTWLQWSYYRKRLISWSARLIDTAFTIAGYGPLFIGATAGALVGLGVNPAPVVTLPWVDTVSAAGACAWSIIGLVSFLLAWYPERTLVD